MDKKLQATESFLFEDLKRGYKLRSQLSEIANGLRLYEKVSVIFLLCETPQAGLLIMNQILSTSTISSQNNLFYMWLKQHSIFRSKDWSNKLAELLTILQNYRLVKIMGYTKQYVIGRFMPKDNLKTYWIPGVRKVLYNMCEDLKSDECAALLGMAESGQNSVDLMKEKYLEYKLLKWNEEGIINLSNEKPIDLQILIKCLKSLDLKKIAHDMEIIVEKTNCELIRNKSPWKLKSELPEYYKIIDRNYLGLCVIINEKNFTNSLFPKRLGTDKDAERLIEVFTAFGFDIKLHEDQTYKQMINTLNFYAKTVDKASSFFILIILSHGSENIIYTSDSLPVDMNTIEMIFQPEVCANLLGKPKIFIVQSCQGEKWQKVVQHVKSEIETDTSAFSESMKPMTMGPQRGDSMIAWSTVQGFASFRDKYNGSWYIQELCNQLWKFGDAVDLVEILTIVNNNLRSKVYGDQFMVPSLLLSLRAKVQFPNMKSSFAKGKKMMFLRLIFDKCFREFLAVNRLPKLSLLK